MAPEEDLFAPSLQEEAPASLRSLPWRVGSQFWPAFFGGSLAVGSLAYVNGRRLGLSRERQRWILISTLAAFLLTLGVLSYVVTLPPNLRVWGRRATQALGVVLYLVLARIQQPADRRHQLFGGQYARMWGPGFLAVLGSAAVTLLAALAMVAARGE